jgi:prevent-host-death family protein
MELAAERGSLKDLAVMLINLTTSEARRGFSGVIKKVRKGQRAVLMKHNKPVAAIVSFEDLRLLRALEDRADVEAARAALAEPGSISLEDLKAELGL